MGRPKVLVPVDGVPMGRRAATALMAAGAAPVVLVGGDPGWSDALGLVLVPDRWPGIGPVGGIATALSWAPTEADVVLLAACDQPWIHPPDLLRMARALADDPTLDVVIGQTRDRSRQPFPSAWRPTTGPAVSALVTTGHRRLLGVLDELSVGSVAVDPSTTVDIDEPDDLPSP